MIHGANNVVNPLIASPFQILGNVYYIHAFDGHTYVAVELVLNRWNYHAWPQSKRQALGGKNKFDFVDASTTIPTQFDPCFKA